MNSVKKEKQVGVPGTPYTFQLNTYKVYSATNVISITMKKQGQLAWDLEYLDGNSDTHKVCYLYIDCEQADAFAHWVFESAYFLPLFKELQKEYPLIKILSYKDKNYMNCIYRGCEIKESEITHHIEDTSNIIFFPEASSLAVHSNRTMFMDHIHSFYSFLTYTISPVKKSLPILYLPRGTRENFKANDRTIPCQEGLVEFLPKAFPGSEVFFTDKVTNIKDQIEKVRSAELLILDYGSNLMFNGFFGETCTVLVIGNVHRHLENPRPYDLLKDSERRGVRYYYLPSAVSAFDVLQAVRALLTHTIPPFHHSLSCWQTCSLCQSSDV